MIYVVLVIIAGLSLLALYFETVERINLDAAKRVRNAVERRRQSIEFKLNRRFHKYRSIRLDI